MSATARHSTTTAHRFNPIDLGGGKSVTPIRREDKTMEFEASFEGYVVAVETSEFAARERVNEYVYDLERGSVPAVEQPALSLNEPTAAYTAIDMKLKDLDAVPTPDMLLQGIVDDEVLMWVFWRTVDWVLYRVAQGRPPARAARTTDSDVAFDALLTALATRIATTSWKGVRGEEVAIAHWLKQAPFSIRVEELICTDELDKQDYGKPIGTQYLCGVGSDEVEIYSPLRGDDRPAVYMLERDEIVLTDLMRVLPSLLTLLADPRVQALMSEQPARKAA